MTPTNNSITELSIKGFMSINKLDRLKLNQVNVLIGANGVGKSNFFSYFRMMGELVAKRLQIWISKQGGADRILTYGVKETNQFESFIKFGLHSYKFALAPTVDSGFTFLEESLYDDDNFTDRINLGSGHAESKLNDAAEKLIMNNKIFQSISSLKVFHFHDSSDTAGVKRLCALHDNDYLRSDASNLAAYLFQLREKYNDTYKQIRKTIALAIPFFGDFILKPQSLPSGEEQIRLLWRQKDNDYALWPSQLSDGSIRFICLTVALMGHNPPATIIIDEPELGLHPYAIVLLGALIRSASTRMQVIISTQSVPLLNEFSIKDLIVVERKKGVSVFKRHNELDFQRWLEDYSLGELWEKNILGGRPR
ncbi:recombinase RecF [Candidatus Magnetomorum sp. HK-1]|nr:recombinase RecF [Candidatus Magnetomorum sp. HK-1]